MPLKVPNYRAVSELFRKKPNEPAPLPQPSGVPGRLPQPIGAPRRLPQPSGMPGRLPQPSGIPGRPTQKFNSPTEGVAPTLTQPPSIPHPRPQDYAVPFPVQPPGQRHTMPMSAPLSDRRFASLYGDAVTRRKAINTFLGEANATKFIDDAAAYRKAHPKYYKGVYDGSNIDRPIKVIDSEKASGLDGAYRPPTYDRTAEKITPERIEVRGDNPAATLMHELFHLDTSGSRPQDYEKIFKARQQGTGLQVTADVINSWRPLDSQIVRDAKAITDRAYGKDRQVEIGSQLGALRVHLEQQGIDTSNKEELRKALRTMGDDPDIMHNFEAQRIHRALNDPTLSPEQRAKGLDALVELMPGIAKANTSQYPYRKIASESSSSLRGLAIMSTISALLKGR